MNSQKNSCTITGVPRKNHVYVQAVIESRRLEESRITASATPITIPANIATTVKKTVSQRPRSTSDVVK